MGNLDPKLTSQMGTIQQAVDHLSKELKANHVQVSIGKLGGRTYTIGEGKDTISFKMKDLVGYMKELIQKETMSPDQKTLLMNSLDQIQAKGEEAHTKTNALIQLLTKIRSYLGGRGASALKSLRQGSFEKQTAKEVDLPEISISGKPTGTTAKETPAPAKPSSGSTETPSTEPKPVIPEKKEKGDAQEGDIDKFLKEFETSDTPPITPTTPTTPGTETEKGIQQKNNEEEAKKGQNIVQEEKIETKSATSKSEIPHRSPEQEFSDMFTPVYNQPPSDKPVEIIEDVKQPPPTTIQQTPSPAPTVTPEEAKKLSKEQFLAANNKLIDKLFKNPSKFKEILSIEYDKYPNIKNFNKKLQDLNAHTQGKKIDGNEYVLTQLIGDLLNNDQFTIGTSRFLLLEKKQFMGSYYKLDIPTK